MGISYGALKAPPVIVRGYAGAMAETLYYEPSAQLRPCPNCGKPVSGRKTYCDAICSNQFRSRKYYRKKKGAHPDGNPEWAQTKQDS